MYPSHDPMRSYTIDVIEDPWNRRYERYHPALDFGTDEPKRAQADFFEAQAEWYRYQLKQAKEAQRQAERDRWLAMRTENHQQSETRTPTKMRVSKPGQSLFAKGKALVKRVLGKDGKDKKELTQKPVPANKKVRNYSIPQLKLAFMSRLGYSHAETKKAAFAIYQYCDKPGIALDTAVVMYLTNNKGYTNKRAARALRILAH